MINPREQYLRRLITLHKSEHYTTLLKLLQEELDQAQSMYNVSLDNEFETVKRDLTYFVTKHLCAKIINTIAGAEDALDERKS